MSTAEFNSVYEQAKERFLTDIACDDEKKLSDIVLQRIEKAASNYALSVIHVRRMINTSNQITK